VLRAATAVATEPGSLGVVIGGSGNGEAIAANKVPGVRCALAWSEETARLGRLHNDATVVSVGARMHDEATAVALVEAFLATDYSGDERHSRRIAMLAGYEVTKVLPPLP
jgi:ribose 5-phosphate isomerase B